MLHLIFEAIIYALECLCFYIEAMEGKLLDRLYDIFDVFAGITAVKYQGSSVYLLDVFFGNDLISAVFWGMAVIGIALTFGFAVAGVVRKLFDSTGEKMKATYGSILLNIFKSILLIILMTTIVSTTITASGVLMDSIVGLFDNAQELADPSTIEFDDELYATMFRILDTVGNHSLSDSYNNRFNINSCFNEIRNDMKSLEKAGVFNYTYDGCEDSWQYMLRQIYLSASIDSDIPIDTYNAAVNDSLVECMDKIKNDASFKPLSKYTRSYSYANANSKLGRMILLSASFGAALNTYYDEYGSFTDDIRRPFYIGDKDIYDLDDVEDFFTIDFSRWNHIVGLIGTFIVIIEFCKILLNCVARIFNIILLYLVSPLFVSVMPLDDGGKTKQWTIAFVVQSFSIFGSIIGMRLLVLFIPIIMDSSLVLFSDSLTNMLAKTVFVIASCITVQRATGLINGILSDNAGYQSILAGDVGSGMMDSVTRFGSGLAMKGLKLGGKVLGGVGGVVSDATGLTTAKDVIGSKMHNWGQSMRDHGGFIEAAASGWKTNADQKAEAERKSASERDADNLSFQNKVLEGLGKMNGGGSAPANKNKAGSGVSTPKGDTKSSAKTLPKNNNSLAQQQKKIR